MNYGRQHIEDELENREHGGAKMTSRLVLHALKISVLLLVLAAAVGGSFLLGTVQGIIDTAPEPEALTVTPLGISSGIYDSEGRLKETLIATGSNRDPVAYDRVPEDLINAFVAIEDERFWTHEGVDVRGILRSAASLLLKGGINGGASTITQQLIKNNVFNGGMEKGWGARFIRKFQEQYLAILLESEVSKEDILINYMNSINLGQNCLGIQVAARRYFQKDVSELTLSECAALAGITQNPYRYNPINFPENNSIRRKSVLNHMLDQHLIDQARYDEALADTEDLYARIAANNLKIAESSTTYSYFTDAVINAVLKDLQTELGYSESDAYTLLYSGGLNIYTTQDSTIQKVLDEEVNRAENYPEDARKWSFSYQLKVTMADGSTRTYTENHIKQTFKLSDLVYGSKAEIESLVRRFKEETLSFRDTIQAEKIYYTIQPQLSAVVMDQTTGQVLAICGGRGDKNVSRSFNRATDTYRSPGSTFKVLSTFAPALDCCGQTLASFEVDEPFEYKGATIKNWWPSNLWLGRCSARQAITYSMNVVSANFLMNKVGLETGFGYLENFGISSLVREEVRNGKVYTDLGPTLCLGGLTNGANLVDMTGAFASLANQGIYNEYSFYTKITDHYGRVLLEKTPESRRVVKDTTAFLLTSAMAGSMAPGSIKNTWLEPSSISAALDRDMTAAGKSGTSTDSAGKSRDYWFVGYTNYYTMGVWSGFDDGGVSLEGNVTMNNYHKTVWKKVMDRIHTDKAPADFPMPEGITTATICSLSGKLATSACRHDKQCQVYTEFFEYGTAPSESCDTHVELTYCKESGMLANEWCPGDRTYTKLFYVMETPSVATLDSPYILNGSAGSICTLHHEPEPETEPETEEEISEEWNGSEDIPGEESSEEETEPEF